MLSPVWSPDGTRFVHIRDGAVYLYDCARRSESKLVSLQDLENRTRVPKSSSGHGWENRNVAPVRPQWTNDGKYILLAVEGDVFLLTVATGKSTRITATKDAEEDPLLSPDGRFLAYRQDNDLFAIDLPGGKPRRLTTDGGPAIWNGKLDWVYPEELNLSRAWWWSPDGKQIAFLQFDVSAEMLHPHVDASNIRAIYEPQRYPKAGTPNAKVRLGVVAAEGGKVRWLPVADTNDTLIARVEWMPGGRSLAVQRMTRVQDKLELIAVDTSTASTRILLTEQDKAWVNLHDFLHFFQDGRRFLWASERDGHRHLYLYGDGPVRQLTRGDWEAVKLVSVDEARGHVWFIGTRDGILERHLYRLDLATGELSKRSRESGWHAASMAPKADFYIDAWQTPSQPLRQTLRDNAGAELALVVAPRESDAEFELLPSQFGNFTGKDGTRFYYQLIKPKDFDPARRYPAIVMVYGGPHSQTVNGTWSGPNLDQALARRGYVIWRMDNRGTNYRGHAFETPVHKEFGRQELADQLEGVSHLIGMGFVDPSRVGIHGWSYGGFMTLYALTHAPKVFAAGAAGAPVTDWRHYDTIYTERYLGLPSQNERGYRAGSPVHSAANLEASLLMVHNFEDDNVLFQNSQHMMAALQRAGKQFETMFYPLKTHGIGGPMKLHFYETLASFFDRTLANKEEGRVR
jgi:dipeptidyl-peptidase-4